MFNKDFWSRLIRPVDLDKYPKLPCPHCGKTDLRIAMGSLQYRDAPIDARTSAFLQAAAQYSPKEAFDTFGKDNPLALIFGVASVAQALKYKPAKVVCFFECVSCSASVSAVGTAAIPKAAYAREAVKLKIEYFAPPIPMFPLPSAVPSAIASELLSAFSNFHSDILSSGAKLRRATEQFCSELSFVQGSLHQRIEQMAPTYPQEAKWLRSLKLVGNEATHSAGVEESDLLHSFEIFAELIDLLLRRSRLTGVQESAQALDNKFRKN